MTLRLLVAIALSVLTLDGSAVVPVTATYSARYTVLVDGSPQGELVHSVRRDGMMFTTDSRLAPTGIIGFIVGQEITEHSVWFPQGDQIVPIAYEYRHKRRDGDIVEKLDFDWDEGRVTAVADNQAVSLLIFPGVLDKQIYEVALSRDLAAGKREMSYPVIDRHNLDVYRYTVVGEEVIDTPLGRLRTLKVEKAPSPTRSTTLWYAVDRDYLLVRLVQTDPEHTYTSYIEQFDRHS